MKKILSRIKVGEEISTFGDNEIEKNKFYPNETSIFKKDADIEKVLVSKKIDIGVKNYKYWLLQ